MAPEYRPRRTDSAQQSFRSGPPASRSEHSPSRLRRAKLHRRPESVGEWKDEFLEVLGRLQRSAATDYHLRITELRALCLGELVRDDLAVLCASSEMESSRLLPAEACATAGENPLLRTVITRLGVVISTSARTSPAYIGRRRLPSPLTAMMSDACPASRWAATLGMQSFPRLVEAATMVSAPTLRAASAIALAYTGPR